MSRLAKISLFAVLFLAIVYGALWLVARTLIAQMLTGPELTRSFKERGMDVALPEPTVNGFPTLVAGGASLSLVQGPTNITVGRPRLSWRPWRPLTASIDGESFTVFHVAGPIRVDLASQKPVDIDIHYQIGTRIPVRFDLAGEALVVRQSPPPPKGPPEIAFGALKIEGRRTQERESIVIDAESVALPAGFAQWNLTHGHLDLGFAPRLPESGGPAALRGWGAAGGAMTLRETEVLFANGAKAVIDGTAGWNGDGLLNGTFTLHIEKAPLLVDLIDQAARIDARQKLLIQSTLSMMSVPGPNGEPAVDLPVTIESGRLRYGSITVPGVLLRAVP